MKIFSKLESDYQKISWAITVMILISLLFAVRGLGKYLMLWFVQVGYTGVVIPILLGDPLSIPYFIEPFISFLVFITTWALATKIKKYQELKYRYLVFSISFVGITFQYLWLVSTPIVRTLTPYLYMKKEMFFIANIDMQDALLQNFENFMLFILSFPLIILILVYYWLFKFCNSHWEEIVNLFKTWEFDVRMPSITEIFMNSDKQREIASKIGDKFKDKSAILIPPPDVELGPNVKKNIMVYIPGLDRTLNMIIVGAIGAGKTAALALPMINQDLHYITYMINNLKRLRERKDFISEEIRGALFNGLTVIEPSNDLCQKVLKLAKAHGIPDEFITYIDPTNPNTPSLNIFNGPVDKVSEMFTMVISGIGEKTDFFFEQSQRTHLKNHIYLLMEHNPDKKVGFSDLILMYNDAQLVYRMMKDLDIRIPDDIDTIKDRDTRNYWLVMQQVRSWFDETYVIAKSGFGKNQMYETIQGGKYDGEYRIIDTKTEHVVGLRNILDDIGKSVLMRRVLFGESDFNFDKFLEYGGILLVNTAKGDLSLLSDVLGKFALLSYQNAVFRRSPMTSSYNALYCDEFPDYIYEDFAKFPSQSRKYKAIVNVICQTTAQLQQKYGKTWCTTLLATLRNKMLYGDATKEDAEEFSSVMGTKEVYEEGESDQEVSAMMDSPNRRVGLSYQKKEKEVLSPSDIIFQNAFECAVKIVQHNKPIEGQIIKANFVPRDEFVESKVKVDPEAAAYWIKVMQEAPVPKNFVIQEVDKVLDDEHSIETMNIENEASLSDEQAANTSAAAPEKDDVSQLFSNVYQQPVEEVKIQYEKHTQKRSRYIQQSLSVATDNTTESTIDSNKSKTLKESFVLDQSTFREAIHIHNPSTSDSIDYEAPIQPELQQKIETVNSKDVSIPPIELRETVVSEINYNTTSTSTSDSLSFSDIFGTESKVIDLNMYQSNDNTCNVQKEDDLKVSNADTPLNTEFINDWKAELDRTD